MRHEFFMAMVPPTTTFQDKQLAVSKGRPIIFDSAELKAVKAKLAAHLSGHVPERKLEGPVRLVAKWCWPCDGTDHADGEWKSTKPDTDNLAKALKDCMTKLGFWADDAQVASDVSEKFWARVPGIYVCIEELS